MDQHSKYNTKQREILLGYFETIPGIHVTAKDVCNYFKTKKSPIGQSTVYRQLERFVDEGILNKYIIDENSPACFEYTEKTAHTNSETCFHCKCAKCGKLIHLHCTELEEIQNHLYEEHRFKMNPMRTVFYGLCGQCS